MPRRRLARVSFTIRSTGKTLQAKYGDAATGNGYLIRLEIAERVADCFDEVYAWAKKEIYHELPVGHVVETVELSKRLVTDEEYETAVKCRDELASKSFVSTDDKENDLRVNSTLISVKGKYQKIINRYEAQKIEKKLPMELHVIL